MGWNVWQPRRFQRLERVLRTSMDTVVAMTEGGRAYVKAIGNREGEHALACELVGSSLAEWLGLPTLDFALLWLDTEDELFLEDDEAIPISRRRKARPGPAFASRAIPARSWSGDPDTLQRLANRADVAGLVVLDTWIGNPDRYPRRPVNRELSSWTTENRDNVLLAFGPRRKPRLVAMDHSKCLYCREGGLRIAYADAQIRDDGIYGLFPAFEPFTTRAAVEPFLRRLGCAAALREFLGEVLGRIPAEWAVDRRVRGAVADLLAARADYLVDNFSRNLLRVLQPDAGEP